MRQELEAVKNYIIIILIKYLLEGEFKAVKCFFILFLIK